MAFFTRPRLNDDQFRQIPSDSLILSGATYFPLAAGLNLGSTGGTFYSFDLTTGGTVGDTLVLSPAGTIIWSSTSGGTAFITNTLTGGTNTGLIFKGSASGQSFLRTISGGSGMNVSTQGDIILLTSEGGKLGIPDDGLFDDGLFSFTSGTSVANAIDDINEVLALLAPQQPPDLDNQSTSGTFSAGKLSFGVSRNDIGYSVADTDGGGTAFDINGNYTISGDRKGLTQNSITGILNDDVTGDGSGIPFLPNAFKDGNVGSVILQLNGVVIDSINLELSTGSTASTYLSVSSTVPVKFDNGNEFGGLVYRTGTYSIPTSQFINGYNYLRIIHSATTFNRQTNFSRWIYDPESTNITLTADGGGAVFFDKNLTGSRFLSGVEYNTGGDVTYKGIASNVYRNVYSNSSTAITFPNRINLGNQTLISVTGSGILNGSTQALPNLNSAVTNAQATDITIEAVLPITNSRVLGNLSTTGELESNIAIDHPFSVKEYLGSEVNELGFLIYNVTQINNAVQENFDGEINRLQARDYTGLLYSNIDSGSYAWVSSQDLGSGNAQHNTGLLVFNGGLYYPNSSLLTTEYGIASGNFDSIPNAPASNANYSTLSGKRNYYRKFKSSNAVTQSTLTFEIEHDGDATNFLTNGGTAGTPTGNQIKFEFAIKRSGGATHGWANPFASTGNPEGIAATSISHTNGKTTVTCTLSTTPRVALNDIVVVRLFVSQDYSEKINLIGITNIS